MAETQIKTISVIGAGIMGRGIAHAAALGGYRTIIEDIVPASLRRAESEIRANLDKAVELYKQSANQGSDRAKAASSLEDVLFLTIGTHGEECRGNNHYKKYQGKNQIVNHGEILLLGGFCCLLEQSSAG